MFFRFFFIVFLLYSSNLCAKQQENTDTSQQELFAQGMQNFEKKNFKKAIKSFESLRSIYPYSQSAKVAMEKLFYIYRIQKKYDEAIIVMGDLLIMYPSEPALEEMQYLYTEVFNEKAKANGRDVALLEETGAVFEDFLKHYPNSQHKKDVEERLTSINSALIYKELEIGYFYEKKRNYIAALKRYLRAFSLSKKNVYHDEILFRIYLCCKIIGIEEEVKNYSELLKNTHDIRYTTYNRNYKENQ